MKITKYAQSTIRIDGESGSVLVDPGCYNFEKQGITRDYFRDVSLLVVTHKHKDHADLEAISNIWNRDHPVILTTNDVVKTLIEKGIEAHVLLPGRCVECCGYTIHGVAADHVVHGERVETIGVLIEVEGWKLYHTGDTRYMKEKPRADIVFVPINDRGVSMSVAEAAKFVAEIEPKMAIPVHYDGPKDRHIDPRDFARAVEVADVDVRILGFNNALEIRGELIS